MTKNSVKTSKKQGRLGILCSGGDAPGMNACIRSIVRNAFYNRIEVLGIKNGFEGLVQDELYPLSLRSVGNIIQRGGTVLGSSRCPEFQTKKGRKKAAQTMDRYQMDKLVVLGGDGSMAGAALLSKEHGYQVIGIPCTIDNDLEKTDFSIGFDTSVQTAVECIDKIRDTADSHGRIFLIEVMGKSTGHIAIETGLAVGAEFVVLPEKKFSLPRLIEKLEAGKQRGKTGSIVIVAEKKEPGVVLEIANMLVKKTSRTDVRTMILGHLQRGGSPSQFDRNLAARMGDSAVRAFLENENRVMVGVQNGKMCFVDFSKVVGKKKPADVSNLELINRLSI